MKVIIDTNVLVSAILKDQAPEAIIIFIVKHPYFEWVLSPEILAEYKTVLSRNKFGLSEELLAEWFTTIDNNTKLLDVNISLKFTRDQKDAKFLTCAIVSNADFLITGDKDFSQAQKLINTKIISVSLFKKIVADTWT